MEPERNAALPCTPWPSRSARSTSRYVRCGAGDSTISTFHFSGENARQHIATGHPSTLTPLQQVIVETVGWSGTEPSHRYRVCYSAFSCASHCFQCYIHLPGVHAESLLFTFLQPQPLLIPGTFTYHIIDLAVDLWLLSFVVHLSFLWCNDTSSIRGRDRAHYRFRQLGTRVCRDIQRQTEDIRQHVLLDVSVR